MANDKNPKENIDKVFIDMNDLMQRYTDFVEEHKTQFMLLEQKMAQGEYRDEKLDPQDIQHVDMLLKVIEEQKLEDAIEGYDRLKYSADFYHALCGFRDEINRIYIALITEQIVLGKSLINTYTNWLANVQKAIDEGNTEPLPSVEDILAIKNELRELQGEMTIQTFKLAALADVASN